MMPAARNAPRLDDADVSPDLAWLVERVRQSQQPWVVAAAVALTAWQERDPAGHRSEGCQRLLTPEVKDRASASP